MDDAGEWVLAVLSQSSLHSFKLSMQTRACKFHTIFLHTIFARLSADAFHSKTFFFFMTTNVCLAIFVYFCLPETKQVALEDIDVLFGGISHVDKGATMLKDVEPNYTAEVHGNENTTTELGAKQATSRREEVQA